MIKSFLKKHEAHIKTFIATFASYIAVHVLVLDITSKAAWYGLLAGAIGSAISVIFNRKK